MLNLIKRNCFMVVCLSLLMVYAANAAADAPALMDIKDPAEKARIQKLIDGARSEGKLIWEGSMIEPVHGKYIGKRFKEYYGLPNLEIQYTYTFLKMYVVTVTKVTLTWHS